MSTAVLSLDGSYTDADPVEHENKMHKRSSQEGKLGGRLNVYSNMT